MTDTIALHDYLDARLILVHSEVRSRKKLLQEIARLLSIPLLESQEECKEKDVYHALLEREKLGNTGIGNGVALPHSRFQQTDKAIIAIVTLKSAIDYESLDGQDVDIAFGLLVPQEATQEHLQLLAEIAGMLSLADFKKRLVSAESADQIMALLQSESVPG